MNRTIALLVGSVLLIGAVLPSELPAQSAVLGQMYGSGVHAYFSQDYVRAHELLTEAINAGSEDPRCYYFRGLALERMGRPEGAAEDFT